MLIGNRFIDVDVSRSLSRLYIIALSTVAILSIAGQFLVQYSLKEQLSDSRVINMAGRQRMLSQRLCKTSILLCNPKLFLQDSEYYSDDLKEVISLWTKVHKGLLKGNLVLDAERHYEVKNSDTLRLMLAKLDKVFTVMVASAEQINQQLEVPTADKQAIMDAALIKILQNERTFLKMMDKIVFQYDNEAQQRVSRLRVIEFSLLIFTLIVLCFEGFFIFKPAVEQIRNTISKLIDSEKNTQQLNSELRVVNESLRSTERQLVEATKEKYEQKISKQKLRSYSMVEGQEEERGRISRELHDGLGQMLTAIKLTSEKLNPNKFESEKDKQVFIELKKMIDETISETRSISFNLMPSVLSDFGVISALKLLIEQTQKNFNIKITFENELTHRLPRNVEIGLYRITQEAINNVVKYANATEILIHLFARNEIINLNILDDGTGFDTRKVVTKGNKGGNGINNMKSRANLLDGDLKIETALGNGTKIYVKLPLKQSQYDE